MRHAERVEVHGVPPASKALQPTLLKGRLVLLFTTANDAASQARLAREVDPGLKANGMHVVTAQITSEARAA